MKNTQFELEKPILEFFGHLKVRMKAEGLHFHFNSKTFFSSACKTILEKIFF